METKLRSMCKHFKETYKYFKEPFSNDVNSVCQVGYFLTPIMNPNRLENGFVEDFKSLPKCVLINGIGFQISDQVIELRHGSYRMFCAEYYRIDYEGKIKNDSGYWENGVIRPSSPIILRREIFIQQEY